MEKHRFHRTPASLAFILAALAAGFVLLPAPKEKVKGLVSIECRLC